MILTAKQELGLKIAVDRYKAREAYTCIAGYAGTGKSTLIKFIVAALEIPPEEVAYIAYTGKATTVLASKGCLNAITAHKFLYDAYMDNEDGKVKFKPKETLDDNYKLIVVDEVSMIPAGMWRRLLTHKIHVLACGDPGQLPPICADDDNQILNEPHVFLDEVMRQAQDSEIIRLSMHIRDGGTLANYNGTGEQVKVITTREVHQGMYQWADQILCATNGYRSKINNHVRQQKGFGPEPQIGDKIISLRNQWDFCSNEEKFPLINGTIGVIESCSPPITIWPPRYISKAPLYYCYTNMVVDDKEHYNKIPVDYVYLKSETPQLDQYAFSQLLKNKSFKHEPPFEFAYAYAITTWKAQGSEWDKVMGFEEDFPYVKKEHQRFIYTMVTRAAKKLIMIKKP